MSVKTETPEAKLVKLIRAEYREMPGLSLTKPQIERFWNIDDATCTVALDALVAAHILKRTSRDNYVLAGPTA